MREQLLSVATCCLAWAFCTLFWMVALQLLPKVQEAMFWVFMVLGPVGMVIAVLVHVSQAAEELGSRH